jgi:hypothetical protein
VNASHQINKAVTGTDVKVVGVGKLHLTADFPKIVGGYTASDGGTSTNVHKYGGLDGAVDGLKGSPASLTLGL